MQTKPIYALLAIILLVPPIYSLAQTSLKEIALPAGQYKVGFRHYVTADSTRTYKKVADWNNKVLFRPISVSLWYPSQASIDQYAPLSVLQYMEVLKQEQEWEFLPNDQVLNWFDYANTTDNQNHLREKTNARRDIKPAAGPFPVVLYAPGYQSSSIENFLLCEYLASHGYIVIASPSQGTENRYLDGGTLRDIETQARDIEFLLKEAIRLPQANPAMIATMGYSFGGLSNVLSQMRNKQIKAIVSLDGTVRYNYELLRTSPFFNLKKVNVPFIHMAQKDIPEQVLKEEKLSPALNDQFKFYDSLTNSQAYQLKLNDLTHPYFSTLGVLFQQRDPRQDKSDSAIMISYKWAAVYSLKFLNAYLKQDSNARRFMDFPERNGIEQGLITQQSKQPQKKTFTVEDFNELAGKQKYLRLDELYASIKTSHPAFSLPEGSLNNLGLQLVFRPGTSQQGINILLLATRLYPTSANLFDSLAEAWLFTGDKKRAAEAFGRSLALDANNDNARKRLKQLGR